MAAPRPAAREDGAGGAVRVPPLHASTGPTTLADNQTKQVALLAAASVPVEKKYLLLNVAQLDYNYGAKVGDTERVNAEVRMKIKNDEASHLGLPLPKGVVRVYKPDSDGNAIFVGEDRIEHTPKNEELDLMLGDAFDVTARDKQIELQAHLRQRL